MFSFIHNFNIKIFLNLILYIIIFFHNNIYKWQYCEIGNSLPPQPFGSVVNQVKNNENVLIKTAGLNPYNFQDVGQELDAWKDVQKVQRAAFPPNRTNDFNKDVTNQYFPHVMPLYYKGVASWIRIGQFLLM
jgi:hypothetical protein